MTSLDFVKELVNAFNVSNYGSKVNTNFVVEGDNIVVKFNCDKGYAKRYLSQMARDLVREYYSDESVARYAFDLGSFPFHFDKKWLKYDKKTRMTKLTVPIDSRVIFNLKVHFAEEFKLDVKNQVIKAIDEKHHLGEKHIEEILNASIGQVEIDSFSGYIKCLLFNSPNLQTYFIGALQEQIKRHCYSYSGFYDIDDNKVYFKDVENIGFVRSVTETSKKRTAYNFNLQGVGNLKVKAERYKGAMGELIFRLAGVPICGYYRDNFISEDRISNGDRFAFIPMIKEGNNLRYLTHMEADKINAKFSHDILTNIRGQTEATRSNEFGEVYAFSDRQIALLIPVIIENSVINKDGQIEIDPELRFQALSPAQSPFNSPMHAGPSGLRTPPNQRKKDTDSGYDSNSPPKPKDSGAQSSSGGPGPSSKVSQIQLEPPTRSPDGALDGLPRQCSEREEETGRMFQLLLGEIGQASTSSQQTDMPSSSYTYIDKRDESMPEDSYFLPSMLTSFPHVITPSVRYGIPRRPILLTTKNDQKSSSREFSARSPCFEDVNILGMKSEEHDKSEQGACSQVGVRALEGAQADDESMPIEIRDQQVRYRPSVPYRRRGEMTCRPSSILFPTAWNDSIFSDLGVSEDSPKDTENICNEEHKEQKVIDKSDQKSSDECSEAKSQESESPKKHGGGVQKIKSFFSSLSKPKQHDASLKRHDVGRDTMRSTPETPVTEKPPVPKAFFSFPGRRKAKSNPPSEVTSPTHEGGPEWQQRLNPDQREELHPLLSPELQKKLDSNSLSPEDEQLKHLLYTPSGQEKIKKNFESQEENLRRSVNAQLPANPSSKKVDRDSSFCSMGSPAVPHKGSVSSKVKECDLQQAKYMSKALEKN